ncbi:MAG: cation-transporting P-type ATPase [Balneolales bacterium]
MSSSQDEKTQKKNQHPPWHSMDTRGVLDKLQSNPDGLDEETAQQILDDHGPNKLQTKRRRTALERFIQQFDYFGNMVPPISVDSYFRYLLFMADTVCFCSDWRVHSDLTFLGPGCRFRYACFKNHCCKYTSGRGGFLSV